MSRSSSRIVIRSHPHPPDTPDVPDSDDPTKAGTTSFVLGEDYDEGSGYFYYNLRVPFELTETAVGAGQTVNLPRPFVSYFEIGPASVVAGQVVEISEVRYKLCPEHSAVASIAIYMCYAYAETIGLYHADHYRNNNGLRTALTLTCPEKRCLR